MLRRELVHRCAALWFIGIGGSRWCRLAVAEQSYSHLVDKESSRFSSMPAFEAVLRSVAGAALATQRLAFILRRLPTAQERQHGTGFRV